MRPSRFARHLRRPTPTKSSNPICAQSMREAQPLLTMRTIASARQHRSRIGMARRRHSNARRRTLAAGSHMAYPARYFAFKLVTRRLLYGNFPDAARPARKSDAAVWNPDVAWIRLRSRNALPWWKSRRIHGEQSGREAVSRNGQTAGGNAVAHVMEMEGRTGRGRRVVSEDGAQMEPGKPVRHSQFWHLDTLSTSETRRGGTPSGFSTTRSTVNGSTRRLNCRRLALVVASEASSATTVGGRWKPIADKWCGARSSTVLLQP